LITPLTAALFKANDEIRDIFYVRKTIESHIAALPAENATPQEIEEVR
jgi:DNA-binding FadR family transcriptional regulator